MSTQVNEKLLYLLNSEFERIINLNKYQREAKKKTHDPYVNYLIDPSFQGVYTLFALFFPTANTDINRKSHRGYYFSKV